MLKMTNLVNNVENIYHEREILCIRALPRNMFFLGSNQWKKICNYPNSYFSTEKKEMAGLGIGIATMKSGERALFHVGWELGYGEEGSFSFPNVPPMADIIYEVELIGFDEIKEVGNPI